MRTVEVAGCAGACYGVERALRMVEECIGDGHGVYTYGPLIHNPAVVAGFEARGVRVAHTMGEIPPSSTVVIRSHGVAPQVLEEAARTGLDVVDATCPHVKKAHDAAMCLAADGYRVLVVGEAGHPEVEGILSRAGSDAMVVSGVDDVRRAALCGKVGIVVQTTQTDGLLCEVVSAVLPRARELKVFNTICAATSRRQSAARELAARSDAMVVVGGKNSGNTRRLFCVCSQVCPRTFHIESPEELSASWFEGVSTVGVTAGASTPSEQVNEVVAALKEMA